MNRFFTLLLAASCLTAVGQVPDYVPTEGLVAWWSLDGNAEDAFVNDLDGTPNSPNPTQNRFGLSSTAYLFDGMDDHIQLSDLQETQFGQLQFSINAWVNLSEFKRHWIFSNYKTPGGTTQIIGFGTETHANNHVLHVDMRHPSGGCELFGNQPLTINEWHMVSLVRDGESVSIYLDSNLDAAGTISIDAIDLKTSFPFNIGMESGQDQFWHGKIDDLGIWHRALTTEEILELHGSTAPTVVYGCTDPSACNYHGAANVDDGTCASCEALATACGEGTIWDSNSQSCIAANTADINNDGCVQLNDLLDLLSAYGDCVAEESAWQCGDPLEYQGYNYETVQIGEQCWFAENLRAGNYLNGDSIPAELSPDEWLNISNLGGGADKGARSVYGEIGSSCTALEGGTCNPDSASAFFGLLYNWWACVDQRGLCPNNWHVPSDNDYSILTLQNGGESIAGGQLKSASSWLGNGVGTNSLGFNALPGGFRKSNGDFDLQLLEGLWWTSTSNGGTGWFRGLRSDTDAIIRDSRNRIHGYSVRCIKDAE